jgi:hypothetical protein
MLIQGLPAGSAINSLTSFTEFWTAGGEAGAADVSCAGWAKAVSPASTIAASNTIAREIRRVFVTIVLIIAAPPRAMVLSLFLTNSAAIARLQYDRQIRSADNLSVKSR